MMMLQHSQHSDDSFQVRWQCVCAACNSFLSKYVYVHRSSSCVEHTFSQCGWSDARIRGYINVSSFLAFTFFGRSAHIILFMNFICYICCLILPIDSGAGTFGPTEVVGGRDIVHIGFDLRSKLF